MKRLFQAGKTRVRVDKDSIKVTIGTMACQFIVVLIAIVLIALTTAYVEFSRGAQTGAVSGIAVAAALLIVVVRAVARRR